MVLPKFGLEFGTKPLSPPPSTPAMAQRVKLRQRIPDEPEDVVYNRFQDDEHVQDVFQNPVRSPGERARPLFAEARFFCRGDAATSSSSWTHNNPVS